ncbi:MAG TPA: hypothetical protein VHS31_20105, partial [Tepidisphaeraceae bacterium]|nr:hypothetical protein [Tepidisphaeraceae bacterium]
MRGVNVSGNTVQRQKKIVRLAATVAAAALLGVASNARADDNTNMVTWSISGSTAMRNFTVGVPGTSVGGLTWFETGTNSLVLSNGTYTSPSTSIQLAPPSYTGTQLPSSTNNGT